MKIVGIILLFVLGVFAWFLMKPADSQSAAKAKCESAVERLTGHDVPDTDVARANVVGDTFNGTVFMAFTVGGQRRHAECVFEDNETRRVTLDGHVLATPPPVHPAVSMLTWAPLGSR